MMRSFARQILLGITIIWLMFNVTAYACPLEAPVWTKVEKKFLADSGRQAVYPNEHLAIIETRNQYELGKLSALRFIEWSAANPKAVIALTSGNTPEFFIKFLAFYKKNWHKPEVQAELKNYGIDLANFPDTSNLKFVQIEEYFPMSATHYKKVSNYIQRHYVSILGLKKENVMLMNFAEKGILAEKGMKVIFMNGRVDMSLVDRAPSSQLEAWQQQSIQELQQFCAEYENKIKAWGGIDLFIGSISYGGNLGFIAPGTSNTTPTHIVKLDYLAAAHSAKDLGGIEHARDKLAVTIGLGTLAIKPEAIYIVLAAGESKASAVRNSIERKLSPAYPSTSLQKYPNARFYITSGAAKQLNARRTEDVKISSKRGWLHKTIVEVIVEIAQAEKKAILQLTQEDLMRHERGKLLMTNPPKPLASLVKDVQNTLIHNLEAGLALNTKKPQTILHTGPHQDDIMLGYYPLMDTFVRKHKNHIAYLTSGFNSVSDSQIGAMLNKVSDAWINRSQGLIFDKSYAALISKFKNYYAKQDTIQINNLDTLILLKHLTYIYDIKTPDELKRTIRWLKDDYFPNKNAGDLDISSIKMLKGMIRESEADRLWSLKNIPLHDISHLRSNFYSGREFAKTPRFASDVLPFVNLYNDLRPDVITVADDPQSSPPNTHYRVLQVVAQGLRANEAIENDKLEVWGYRNIWFRYSIPEANIFVPVSAPLLAAQKKAFVTCFTSQRAASFPSPFFEGDFAALTTQIQRDQLADLKLLLGSEYFAKHMNPEIRNAAGLIYFNKMSLDEFLSRAEDLHLAIELEESFES